MQNRLRDAMVLARRFLASQPDLLNHRLPSEGVAGVEHRALYVHEDGPTSNLMQRVAERSAKIWSVPAYPINLVVVPAHEAQVVIAEDGSLRSPDRILRCLFLRYPDRAEIRIMGNLNLCWTRFALCKELAHLLMDSNQGLRTSSTETQLRMALSICLDDPDQELSAEEFAWFVAAELMVPFIERSAWGSADDSANLARQYLAPKAIIDLLRAPHYLEVVAQLAA